MKGILNVTFKSSWQESNSNPKASPSEWSTCSLLVSDKEVISYKLYQFSICRRVSIREFVQMEIDLLIDLLLNGGGQSVDSLIFDLEDISRWEEGVKEKVASLDILNLGFVFLYHPGENILNMINPIHKVWVPEEGPYVWNRGKPASVITVSGDFFFQRQRILSFFYSELKRKFRNFFLASDSPLAPLYGIPFISSLQGVSLKGNELLLLELTDFSHFGAVREINHVDVVIDNDDIFFQLSDFKRKRSKTSTFSFIETSYKDMRDQILKFYSHVSWMINDQTGENF